MGVWVGYLSVVRYRCSARSQSPRRQKGTVGGLEKVFDIDNEDKEDDEDGDEEKDEDEGKKVVRGGADVMDGEWSAEGAGTAAVGWGESEKLSEYSSACCAWMSRSTDPSP